MERRRVGVKLGALMALRSSASIAIVGCERITAFFRRRRIDFAVRNANT
jgi:hypothetical protein